ncbi:MAG TPA: DoxX family protein [Steroidobacteraceae bacterium]|nr:DoxX family protein [Steroidobacteraceae bacterium]
MVAITRLIAALSQALNWLQAPFALATRLYVSQVFLASGWLKLTNWGQTIDLFKTEYHTPVLPPTVAAVAGTFGELFFPILLILGIGGRLGALGLFAVNLMAVVSYWHVLGTDEFIAGLRQHELWGFMLAMLAIYGSGALTVDRLFSRRTHLQPAWE